MDVKCSVYIATSVDGFIADAAGGIQWLHDPAYTLPEAGDYGYSDFMETVDTLVMGRRTFEKVSSFSTWPYRVPVVVLATTYVHVPDHLRDRVTLDAGEPTNVVARLTTAGSRHLYIDGGQTVQRFLQSGLINELTITRIPILLGRGISLFGSADTRAQLRLLALKPFANGFVQMKYEVLYADQNN